MYNGTLILSGSGETMDYIKFGHGKKNLVIIPGLGDGLRTVKGTAFAMSLMYRAFAKHYTVYMFSRKNELPESYSTRDMARDQIAAMDALGIQEADTMGVSMGGMIAQYIAIDFPERVSKLVLVVTSSKPNETLINSITSWNELAQKGDHTGFMKSNLHRIYSEQYCRNNQWMIPLSALLTKPKSYDRFFIQSKACLEHNAFTELSNIKLPTFVIGGAKDLALSGAASKEIAEAIPGSKLLMYPELGHGLYEEDKNFQKVVLDFLCL